VRTRRYEGRCRHETLGRSASRYLFSVSFCIHEAKLLNILVLVVLYRAAPSASKTLLSLAKSTHVGDQVSVLVWDNSRTELSESEVIDSFGFKYDGVPNNMSLAKVYNRVIKDYFSHDLFVLFDQDTEISVDYFEELIRCYSRYKNSQCFLYVPRVFYQSRLISPGTRQFVKGVSLNAISPGLRGSEKLLGIASGLAIDGRYISSVLQSGCSVFDERLELYGIDTKFFMDYEEQGRLVCIMRAKLYHDSALRSRSGVSVRRIEKLTAAWLVVYTNGFWSGLAIRIYVFYFVVKSIIKWRDLGYFRIFRTVISLPVKTK
jgi:GT2 family glycosyltransferase